MWLSELERMAERVIPDSRWKESIIRAYLAYRNPLYPLRPHVTAAELGQGEAIVELFGGVRLHGLPDMVTKRTVRYAAPSKLGPLSSLREYCDFLEILAEVWV